MHERRDPRQSAPRRQSRAQSDQRQAAHPRDALVDRRERQRDAHDARPGRSPTRTAAYIVSTFVVWLWRTHVPSPPSRASHDLFARRVVLERRQIAARSTSESPSTRPSCADERHARARSSRPIASASASGVGEPGLPREQRGGEPRLVQQARARCRARIDARSERSTSHVETASASDVARKMPRNVRVRKVTAREAADRRACSRTA